MHKVKIFNIACLLEDCENLRRIIENVSPERGNGLSLSFNRTSSLKKTGFSNWKLEHLCACTL